MKARDFWKGKRVLVTGHTGFKGSWLSIWLRELGAIVSGYALEPPTEPSLFALAGLAGKMDSVIGDIRDLDALSAAIVRANPDIILHLAAQPLVRLSYQEPLLTYETNVLGTAKLLEAARRSESVRAIVVITTDKCYENEEWQWGYRENDRLGGYDPYSSSKACAELVVAAYRSSFLSKSVSVATARAGNVIGGGDWAADRLVPDIVKAIREGRKVLIRSPESVRPWQHVLEPLSGYLRLASALYEEGAAFAEAWNFGPDDSDAKPVKWIVERLCGRWPGSMGFELDAVQGPHEATYLKLDCSKAKARLGWTPVWNLETALAKIVEWNIAYRADRDMYAQTAAQIGEFEADAEGRR